MKYSQSLSAIVLAMTTLNVAQARQVKVDTFTAAGREFRLLEPGHAKKPPEPDRSLLSPPTMQLDSDFAALASEHVPVSEQSLVANLSVPSWMRGSGALSGQYDQPTPSGSDPACGRVRYAPHPVLNATQELRRQRYFDQMAAAACAAGVPIHLFDALIIQESRYNPLAISSKGASGLTQLMPGTATSLGVFDRWSIAQNLNGGARYLRKQLDTFGNWALALGAYNAGPGNVMKYGGLPPFRETRGYVRAILASVSSYQRIQRSGIAITPQPSRGVSLASFSR